MELAVGLFASMAAGATTVASGVSSLMAGAAGASAITGAAGASSALSVLQGVATAGSILSTLVGGIGAYQEAQMNSQMATLAGQQEVLASEENALRIKRDLVQKVGAARVAFAGSGVTIASGQEIENDLQHQADFETGLEKNNAKIRAAGAAARAGQIKRSGDYSLLSAAAKAAGTGLDYKIDIAKRG